ncbi:PucR family transcriptional regulator [Mycolicibacterium komossense]|uniref:PucR family transcriptional regulator ligand-binding domain-containing protein n=1 Tax=Mycolicibacterium komossense TaxID=1779 RepID=A0ABT3CAZ1_9MYCO|nr:PucR family transcriptional regulator [Mycolicibacterium komossense]MCV7226596.1 PucR family transcriptional regulator ligand-binding domain-containing protein [Mycolicibacterium komossense]
MSWDSPLSVAAALTVPPLDLGSVIAGHQGLTREVLWVDIMHAPAESFVRAGDLVLTTGADIRQAGVRDFLTYLTSSPAAGVVLSPPPEVAVHEILASLVPLADRHEFPVVLLPWEVAFAEVQRSLLPLVHPSPQDVQVQMVIGRRDRDDSSWNAFADTFAKALNELALSAGVTVSSSVTDDLVMSHFSSAMSTPTVSGLVASAQQSSAFPENLVSWVLLPPERGQAFTVAASVPALVPEGPVGPRQFAEVLRQHPGSMATILQTLQPLVDYDRTRRGQVVHTLEILLNEATNTSAAARALYLNRHSLLYRIKLIEELTGLSLKNHADRFQLEVSVRVHQINEARMDRVRRHSTDRGCASG